MIFPIHLKTTIPFSNQNPYSRYPFYNKRLKNPTACWIRAILNTYIKEYHGVSVSF